MYKLCAERGRALTGSQLVRRLNQNRRAQWQRRVPSAGSRDTIGATRRHKYQRVTKSPFDCQSAAVLGKNVCMRATAIERTDEVVRTLRRAGGGCLGGERRTNSSVGRASTRTTTRQCNYQDAKAAPCMRLLHADGDMQRGSTNFCGNCRLSALPLPRRSAYVAVCVPSHSRNLAAKLNRHSVCLQ
jgi:hypothetical protein